MLYSPDRGFVFVAVPKTGTTAIQKRLRELDPNLMLNALPDANGKMVKVRTHATVAEIREILGPRAEALQFIAFIRDPRAVIRSKYNFYKSGRPVRDITAFFDASAARTMSYRNLLGRAARIAVARLLPLSVWGRLYPFKSSSHFIDAPMGQLAVDHLGRFEHLQHDFRQIFSQFGYSPDALVLSVENDTGYAADPAEDVLLARIARYRLKRDLEIRAQFEDVGNSAHA